MSFFTALTGVVSGRARVQAHIDNFVGTYRDTAARRIPPSPPCVTLYETFMLMTRIGVNAWFRTAPVVTNLISIYSCITPPSSAMALAHQFCIVTEPKCYMSANDPNVVEYAGLMRQLADCDGYLSLDLLKDRFHQMHGSEKVSHPNGVLFFRISDRDTLAVFRELNKNGLIEPIIKVP